jgi:hypothetical protein
MISSETGFHSRDQTPGALTDHAPVTLQKNTASPAGGGNATQHSNAMNLVLLAVMFGMIAAGFDVVMFGVAGVTVGAVGVMRRFFVIASFVMLGGFTVMLGRMLVMFGGLMVMLNACMVFHDFSPGSISRNIGMIRRAI